MEKISTLFGLKTTKNIIIIEGPDHTGKSWLSQYLHDYVNGKCHTLHSNYNPKYSAKSHYNQHKLISKYVNKQFNKKYYTGNNLVILDRNYISDIVYGNAVGYGSKGSLNNKLNKLDKIFKLLSKNKDVKITVIYCCLDISEFNPDSKEELLNTTQNELVTEQYDEFFTSEKVNNIFNKYNIKFLNYSYKIDPSYSKLLEKLEGDVKIQ